MNRLTRPVQQWDAPHHLQRDLRQCAKDDAGYDFDRGLSRLQAALALGTPPAGSGPSSGGAGGGGWSSTAWLGTAMAGAAGAVVFAAVWTASRPEPAAAPPASRSRSGGALVIPAEPAGPTIELAPAARALSPAAPSSDTKPESTTRSARPEPPESGTPRKAESPSSLQDEIRRVAEARAALARDPARALALIQGGDPAGVVLAPEREAIAILALFRLGRGEEARPRAERFLARHPRGPFAEWIRQIGTERSEP